MNLITTLCRKAGDFHRSLLFLLDNETLPHKKEVGVYCYFHEQILVSFDIYVYMYIVKIYCKIDIVISKAGEVTLCYATLAVM